MEWDNLHELLRSLYDDMMLVIWRLWLKDWRDWVRCSM